MRREQDNITRTSLHWTPEGKRKRRRLRNTECRTVEAELKTMQHIWGSIQKLARSFIACSGTMGNPLDFSDSDPFKLDLLPDAGEVFPE